MNVSIFKSYKEVDNPHNVHVNSVLSRIKQGDKGLKEQVENLWTLDKEKYKEEKKKLPIACFNGTFKYRSKEGFEKGSTLLILDFDDIDNPEARRQEVQSKPFIYSVFRSPNGKDFKALAKVPELKSDYEYKMYFDLLTQEFPELDQSGKDISRACFFSYDPDLYLNPAATTFKERRDKMKVKYWDKVNTALQKIEDAIEGEKHHIRTKIAYLFGGWVASKSIGENEAMTLLERSVAKNTTDFEAAMKTVRGCLQNGKQAPLSLGEQRDVLNMKTGLGKVYYHMDEVWDKVQNFVKEGYTKGMDLGWQCLEERYSMKRGATSYVYGYPYSGKSQLFHEIYVNLAYNYGTNTVIFSPETGNIEHIYAELISIAMKKSIVGKVVDQSEFETVSKFIRRKFWVIDPMGKEFNMKDLLSQVETIERSEGVKIDIISVDPLNYLDLPETRRYDLAQGKDLDIFLADAKKNDRHNVIITHVRDIQPRQIKDSNKDVIGTYFPLPSPFDVANGQMFYRKGMGMICVYRPLDTENSPLEKKDGGGHYEENETLFVVQKAKPKGVGKNSSTSLYYDVEKNCYYEYINGYKSYSWQWKEPKKVQQNHNFMNENKPKEELKEEEKPSVF